MASVYKRGGQYWGRVQRGGRELRRSLRTPVKSKAQKRLSAWLEELDNLAWGDKPRSTFRAAMEVFLTEHCETIKEGAALRYRVSAKALFRQFQGDYLDQITKAKWREFVAARRADGVSGASINRDRACLSKMFATAMAADLCAANPVPAFPREREPEGRVRYLTREEYQRLIDACSKEMRPIVILAVNTGMRLGEILTLTWGQIDGERGEIHIPKTKTDEPRSIPLPAAAAAQLPAQGSKGSSARVFSLAEGPRYPVQAASKRFVVVVGRAKIKDFRFHDLRHTFASWATKGWHEWQARPMRRDRLQLWLGHKSAAMTSRYAHLDTEDLHTEMRPPAQDPAQPQRTSPDSGLDK